MTAPRRAQHRPAIRPWLLGLAAAVGVGLLLLTAYGRATVSQVQPPAKAPATATPTPTEVWRPLVRVDWSRYPPKTKARIDTLGERHDCDALMEEFDAAIRKDAALAGYIYAWFGHSRLCVDAYYQPTEEPS